MNEQIPPRILEILEWPVIQEELRKRCGTPLGKILTDAMAPLGRTDARNRIRKITHLKETLLKQNPPDFSGIADIGPLVTRAEKEGLLKLEDLALVRGFTLASGRILRFLREHKDDYPGLADDHARMDKLSGITETLASSITENDELNDSVYPELRRLRNDVFYAKQEIEKQLGRIVHAPSMDQILQEKIFTTRNDRYVVLVKSAMKERLRGMVHDISASGATYYIEPEEITPLNNRALMLEKELQAETVRILRALSAKVTEHAGALRNNLEVIGGLDFLTAAARFSIDTRGSEPEIPETAEMTLYQARHPILYLMSPDKVVANDVELGGRNKCLIISGANTGGKTVLLKTIGLCALFIMFGLHAPVGPDSRIGVFSRILADIGDDQNLSQSLSTFSGQIVIINEMLEVADERTLVMIDEIVVGTNPRQGAALAQAILESLMETGGRIVVTTHYSELKELPSSDGRFQNASVSFDLETLRPAYRLVTGLPGVSYAFEIAENYGLPGPVISRSRSLLDSRELSMEAMIEKIQRYEQELTEEKRRLDETAAGLGREKNKYDELMISLEKRAQQIKQKEGIDFLAELREYRRLVAERIAELQRMNIQEAGRAHQELRSIEETTRMALDKDKEKLYRDKYVRFEPDAAQAGDRVFVMPLEKEGTIESIDNARRLVALLLGNSIRSVFGFDDLFLPARGQSRSTAGRKKEQARRSPAAAEAHDGEIPSVIQTTYNTIDLRGKRVEEGLRMMEQDFDRMARGGVRTVVVIHGHGTGAMKQAVRENLRGGLYALDYRPGVMGEGGDGVTIVRLKG